MNATKTYKVEKELIWFRTFDNISVEEIASGACTQTRVCYDYEYLSPDVFHFYIDIRFCIQQLADISVRTTFIFKQTNIDLEEIFTPFTVYDFLGVAFHNTYSLFKERCADCGIETPDGLTKHFRVRKGNISNLIKYLDLRKKADSDNEALLSIPLIYLDLGFADNPIIKTTFAVLDEVLFHNANFDTEKNRVIFLNLCNYNYYLTLKAKSFRSRFIEIELNLIDSVMFLQMLDGVRILLASKKSKMLKDALSYYNIGPKDLKQFDEYSKEFLAIYDNFDEDAKELNLSITVNRHWFSQMN